MVKKILFTMMVIAMTGNLFAETTAQSLSLTMRIISHPQAEQNLKDAIANYRK